MSRCDKLNYSPLTRKLAGSSKHMALYASISGYKCYWKMDIPRSGAIQESQPTGVGPLLQWFKVPRVPENLAASYLIKVLLSNLIIKVQICLGISGATKIAMGLLTAAGLHLGMVELNHFQFLSNQLNIMSKYGMHLDWWHIFDFYIFTAAIEKM